MYKQQHERLDRRQFTTIVTESMGETPESTCSVSRSDKECNTNMKIEKVVENGQ
jgi:hypothetical protein